MVMVRCFTMEWHMHTGADPSILCTTNAFGSWGCRAWSGQGWFQFEWVKPISSYNIMFQELLLIVLVAALWERPY